MNRLVFALACVLAFACPIYAMTDAERDGFTGPVRMVLVESAPIEMRDGRWIEGRRVMHMIATYTQYGARIHRNIMDADEQIRYCLAFDYDAGSDRASRAVIIDGDFQGRMVMDYDESGNLSREAMEDIEGNVLEYWNYFYDEARRRTGVEHRDVSGQVHRSVYTLDERGLVVREDVVLPDGSKSSLFHEYDHGCTSRDWNKRTTLRLVHDENGSRFEPVMNTYRIMSFYGGT